MSEKQGLNGAYYGPAIPPPRRYHRPGRGSSCCGCCCLVTFLLKVIVTVLALVGLFILVVWLIFRPINKVKVHVTDVALMEFNHTNNMLRYNLTFNVHIRNPNKKIGIYYDRIEAKAFYEGQRFGYHSLTPFYQGHKNTTVLNVVFNGQQPVTLQGQDLTQFNSEKAMGLYSITTELSLRVRFKLGKVKTTRFKPKIECNDLNSHLYMVSVDGSSKCDIKFW
ncbi:hypothetical protein DKX38_023953 [Salix brachista]|uniref:Late embryogenesis abundant protein LEA-2 subgroup domain-containing protein n=1 Tax=Salix brachista TaxID=2182728 RepID=A0A5N5JNY5_9ROSI|nr:hypothetical protein DKX38_023953 [Salix brachista]